jgi:PST family polysaccharide transporter
MRKKIFENILWLSSEQILRLSISFFIGAWVARYLQPQQFGQLNYGIAFVGLFAPLTQLLDLNQIIIRDLTSNYKKTNKILGTSFAIKLVSSLIAIILIVFFAVLLNPDNQQIKILIFILSLPNLFSGLSVIDCWFIQQVESKYSVSLRNIVFIFASSIRILLLITKSPLIAFALIIAVEQTLNYSALVLVYNYKGLTWRKWKFSWSIALKLLNDSWLLLLASFAIGIYLRIDQIMLGQIIGEREVGIYSVAVRFSELFGFFSAAVVSSAMSTVISSKTENNELFYKKLQNLFDIVVVSGYGFAIILIILSGYLINLVYGSEYSAAAQVIRIHAFSIVFMFIGAVKHIWIIAENKGIFFFVCAFFGASINILLNFLLIPKYQSLGAATATLISYCFTDYIMYLVYPPAKKLGMIMTKSIFLFSPITRMYQKLIKV